MASIAEILATYNQLPRGANAQLESVLPALQFQAAQQAHERGGVGGLLASGFFPQAQQVSAAQVGQATAALRGQQSRVAGAEADILGQLVGGGPGIAGGGMGQGGTRLAQLDQMIGAFNALGRSTEGMRAMRKPYALSDAFQQGDYFGGIDYLRRAAPEFIPDYIEAAGGPRDEDVSSLITSRRRAVDALGEHTTAAEIIEGINLTEGNAQTWVVPLSVAFNKLLQEGAVLEGEVRQVVEGNLSLIQRLMQELETIDDINSPTAKLLAERIKQAAREVADIRLKSGLDFVSDWREENEAYRIRPERYGMVAPGRRIRERASDFLTKNKSLPLPVPRTASDGNTYRAQFDKQRGQYFYDLPDGVTIPGLSGG